jgi:choline dehydrogenase-like flavoprotein
MFALGAKRRGYELEPMRRNTKGCNGCGRCNFGCPHGAKMSVDMTYLPRAVAAGARIYSDCRIEKIVVRGRRAVGVRGRLLDATGKKRGKVAIRAKRVVVAAGSLHTSALLKRNGIGTECGQLGRNMTLHPGFRCLARFDDPIRGWQGSLQSAYSDAFMDERITLTGLFVPPGVLAATMPGFGPDHARRTRDIPYLAMFGGMIHDEGGGEVIVPPFGAAPIMTYRMDPLDRAAIPRIIRHMAETFFAAGAREVFIPVFGMHGLDADAFRRVDLENIPATKIECSSQHPMGTCRMGISAGNSVTDANGAAWDVDELYVADGSIVPTSLGVNPQLTIMALATRVAWHLREKKFAPMPD